MTTFYSYTFTLRGFDVCFSQSRNEIFPSRMKESSSVSECGEEEGQANNEQGSPHCRV